MFRPIPTDLLRVQWVVNKLVSFLRRQHVCTQRHADPRQERDTRADGAEVPRLVKLPARNGKLAIVVVQVSLHKWLVAAI